MSFDERMDCFLRGARSTVVIRDAVELVKKGTEGDDFEAFSRIRTAQQQITGNQCLEPARRARAMSRLDHAIDSLTLKDRRTAQSQLRDAERILID